MTVKENHTILSRATIRAIAITALVAVAAVFSTQNTGVAFGSCPYTPNSGDQADLWLDMGSEDTYFTDAEWQGLQVKTFSLKGPFRGEVNIRTYTGWGLTTSTTSSKISCTTAQSYTAIKNTESMPIYLKRCNWGDYTSLQFGITHERKCIVNGTQAYIYPMLITESDMEGTPLTYTTGGEDGRGTQNTPTTTETTYTPPAQPQTPQQPIDTTQTSQQPDDTCVVQPGQAEEQNGPNPPGTSMPTGDTVIRGRWTGPNVSSAQQISDAMKIDREAIQLILKVRDGKATPAEAQETADTLWLMSHEARKLPIWYENHQNGKNKLLWKLLRQWVTEEGLEPSEEARTAGVPWSVFYNRYGETFTPKQARERYGGAPDGNIGLWRNRNPVAWYQNDPGGLDEVMFGPPKEHGEGKSGDRYSEQDGTWITQAEAFSKYGIRPAGTTMEEWEQNHSLTRLPKWKHPDEQEDTASEEDQAPVCVIQPNTQIQLEGADGIFWADEATLCIRGVPRSALHNPSPQIAQLTADADALYDSTQAAYEDWRRQWRGWLDDGMKPAERGEELLGLYRSLETERRAIEVRYLKDQIRLLAADPRCLCQPAPADSEQAGECNSLPQHMLPTRTDVDDLGVTYAGYGGNAPLSDELADLMVKLAVGLRAEGISRAGFPTRYAGDIRVQVQQPDTTAVEMSLAEYMELETTQTDTEPPEESAEEIPNGPITIGIAGQTNHLPLTVGQTISYRDAVQMGDPLMAGMVVANIETHTSPNSGHVMRNVTLHGTGGAPPPSTRPANAPTELTQIMRLPGPPELTPGTVITPAMSIMIADDYRYMDMTVQTVVPTADGLVKIVWLSPPNP